MEISEEEKKAIELLEDIKNNSWTTKYIMSSDSKNAELLLNLIEKLQKENEELKGENEYNKLLLELKNNFTIDKKTGNYKWNVIEIQKIKDKIEELKQKAINYGIFIDKDESFNIESKISILQELLGDK